ncbi:MAG: molybdopterin molybdotransferase MoeA [Candidatus Didemnitutus sp.]|nr:molybdopterin molybdotransferase MoeA [Candidatus Didemnitutus sp.]
MAVPPNPDVRVPIPPSPPGECAPALAQVSVGAARATVLAGARVLGAERLPFAAASGRRLAADILAGEDCPAFDTSAVDGYAVTARPEPERGSAYRIIGEAAAGRVFQGTLKAGECVRILTGAAVPSGAGAVLRQEDVRREGDGIVVDEETSRDYLRRRAENHAAGSIVLPAGTKLGPIELSILAAHGEVSPLVHRVARVAHLVTGSELVAPDAVPTAGQVRDSNSALIAALVDREGAQLVAQLRLPDDAAVCEATIRNLPDLDVLLISGGAGEGDYDHAVPVLQQVGFSLQFRSVRVRPGKPLGFAVRGAQLAFALPGNPVSHWATWQLFVGPALRQLAGAPEPEAAPRVTGTLATAWRVAASGRDVFWPARAEPSGGGWRVWPARFVNSGDLAGVAGSNSLLCAGADGGDRPAGSTVELMLVP